MTCLLEWFGGAGNAAFVATLLSICAIVVSGIAFRKSHKTQNRLVKIEEARERDRLKQQKKADLVAQIVSEVESQQARRTIKKYMLRIENKGLAEARDVKVVLDDKPVLEHPAVVGNQQEGTQIGPQSCFDYLLGYSMNTPKPACAVITWSDDSGEHGSYKTSLS